MDSAWLYPLILAAGALQAWGPPMNGALRIALTNPWLASLVSFLQIVALLIVVFVCMPRPLPTIEGLTVMHWWSPHGGLIGAFAVVAGLLFVDRVGAGAFADLTITANIDVAGHRALRFAAHGGAFREPRVPDRGSAHSGGNCPDLLVLRIARHG
ncbi:DMT family transporter [Beijerinckia indica]|uniref:EamA domain-containing protein n=1 Tax=Beijerinckia indica subsp. indica (strain ATCC 9039 / DSM 1715 / NCIMB 8712) TaxID=395963 RepID=B2IL26_BEII9|nr:hypothetical protein Bind_3003 [Beijerinckia indica subsp. indica ATCC 9039]